MGVKVIYCAGEQARVVLDILDSQPSDDEVELIDDDARIHGETVAGRNVVGGREALDRFDPATDSCIVAFGDEQSKRLSIAERIADRGFSFFSAIHPSVTSSSRVTIGDGCMVNAGTYLGPDTDVEEHVLIDSHVNVSHDGSLRTGATLGPGATIAGGVTVGRDAFVGAGATVIDDLTVGEGATVGAGAVVTSDVQPGATVAGIPAKPLE